MKIVEKMIDGPVDIVGDVHGQIGALEDLLERLGYDGDGTHPDGRRLVFVGDLVDRGPDSVAVVERVKRMAESRNAQCVLGNHELNIVREDRKVDNGWYFGDAGDGQRHATSEESEKIREFFSELPLALERDDLRVVHACWNSEAIGRLSAETSDQSSLDAEYRRFRDATNDQLESSGLLAVFEEEESLYGAQVVYGKNDPDQHWPDAKLLPGHAAVNEARQMGNPVAVLTSGEERAARKIYPAGGKFRFVNRVAWWNRYEDNQAVIIGHYWRLYDFGIVERPRAAGIDVFKGTGPDQWLGARKNVYCVDFSVGGRGSKYSSDICRLAAVRWPEATVMFDDGEVLETDARK
jgi:hypothetical protein